MMRCHLKTSLNDLCLLNEYSSTWKIHREKLCLELINRVLDENYFDKVANFTCAGY
jgi:hypothetical protein